MRKIGIALIALVLVNVVLVSLRRSLSADRAALRDEASMLSQRADDARLSTEQRRAVDELIARALTHGDAPRDIGALRDLLVGAERGLSIDRLSLDFRPEEQLPPGFGGTRVQASLHGRFDSVYVYLERIEAMFLPLSLDNLILRGDAASVTLTVQWGVWWPLTASEPVAELSPVEVSQLHRWLAQSPPPRPERDVFTYRDPAVATAVSSQPPAQGDAPAETDEPEEASAPERPDLTGFVLARPELEPDVRRRVLAALRYQGEMRLVMVGDTIGGYVVDGIEARDSVTLTRADTGERIRLTLQ